MKTVTTILLLIALPLLALAGGRNDLIGKRTYMDAAADSLATGLKFVVFVDCEAMPVDGKAIVYHATQSEWRKITGSSFRGAVVAYPENGQLVVSRKIAAPSREVQPMATPFEPREYKIPPFEALLKGLPFEDRPELTVDDRKNAKGPWPVDVPFIHGLVHYKPTKVTQKIYDFGSQPQIDIVNRRSKGIPTKWHQPGGLEGIAGWTSHLYKKVPEPGVREWEGNIKVKNSTKGPPYDNGKGWQYSRGILRSYPVGTIFMDVLSNASTGKVFEHRVREKTESGWHSYIAYRDREQRPAGYHGVKDQCVTCHNTKNNPLVDGNGPGSGIYFGGSVPGGDTVVSDPMKSLGGI